MRNVFSTDGITATQLVTTVSERTDTTLQGVVPVAISGGNSATWALAYSNQAGGLYGLKMSGSNGAWEDQKAVSKNVNAGEIGGVCAAIVVVLGIAGFFYWRRRRQQREARKAEDPPFSDTKAEEPQYSDIKLEPISGNSPSTGNDVNGSPGQTRARSQEQSRLYSQQHHQQTSHKYPLESAPQSAQQVPQQYSQEFPQQGPHADQMYEFYPPQQPNPMFNTQPIPSAPPQPLSAPFSYASQPSHQHPSPSTSTSIPTVATAPSSFSTNASSAQQLQDIQFSSHPRPHVTTMVGGVQAT